jgi:flagellar motor component MotA
MLLSKTVKIFRKILKMVIELGQGALPKIIMAILRAIVTDEKRRNRAFAEDEIQRSIQAITRSHRHDIALI